jgi:opacity protein-like surface antigen
MRKSAALIAAALSALSVDSMAASDFYVGLDVFGSHNRFDYDYAGISEKIDTDSEGAKLKFGALLVHDLRFQGYLLTEKFNEPPFDYTHDRLSEVGLDLIKEFVISPGFSPFIQGGVGYGSMDLDRYYYNKDTIEEVSFKLGFGAIFRVAQHVELMAGLDFQWRQWGDVRYNGYTLKTDDTSQRYYGGINFLF